MEAAQKTRGRAPKGQGELLRERLIDAALAILDEGHDASEISIRGVTRRAGVSPTAFYLHFDDREELMLALLERGFTEFGQLIQQGADRGADPPQRLISACAAYIAFSREWPGRYRLLFAPDLNDESVLDGFGESLDAGDAAFEDLVELISDYLDEGRPPEDVQRIALGFWMGLHGYATLCEALPTNVSDLTDEQYIASLTDAWLGPPTER
ncbi:MAG: TetR/AcrR family transcriptional regulator [Solirubrobacterales bacterium]